MVRAPGNIQLPVDNLLTNCQGMPIGHVEVVIAERDHLGVFDAIDMLDFIDNSLGRFQSVAFSFQ